MRLSSIATTNNIRARVCVCVCVCVSVSVSVCDRHVRIGVCCEARHATPPWLFRTILLEFEHLRLWKASVT